VQPFFIEIPFFPEPAGWQETTVHSGKIFHIPVTYVVDALNTFYKDQTSKLISIPFQYNA
jgi:hypothetical protein